MNVWLMGLLSVVLVLGGCSARSEEAGDDENETSGAAAAGANGVETKAFTCVINDTSFNANFTIAGEVEFVGQGRTVAIVNVTSQKNSDASANLTGKRLAEADGGHRYVATAANVTPYGGVLIYSNGTQVLSAWLCAKPNGLECAAASDTVSLAGGGCRWT